MAKFSGMIGFVKNAETYEGSGVWIEETIERPYRGDVINDVMRWKDSTLVNESLNISNKFSIVADAFAMQNIGNMRYVDYLGTKWKIMTVEINRPRIVIYLGGLYNGTTEN